MQMLFIRVGIAMEVELKVLRMCGSWRCFLGENRWLTGVLMRLTWRDEGILTLVFAVTALFLLNALANAPQPWDPWQQRRGGATRTLRSSQMTPVGLKLLPPPVADQECDVNCSLIELFLQRKEGKRMIVEDSENLWEGCPLTGRTGSAKSLYTARCILQNKGQFVQCYERDAMASCHRRS
jgi:hypothetical protein